MACAHPDTTIHAITTVAGNVSLEHTSANACKLVEFLGLDTPVYVGCAEPLMARRMRMPLVFTAVMA
jgi:inosine-uridine nucleoside N-ribohydrolase